MNSSGGGGGDDDDDDDDEKSDMSKSDNNSQSDNNNNNNNNNNISSDDGMSGDIDSENNHRSSTYNNVSSSIAIRGGTRSNFLRRKSNESVRGSDSSESASSPSERTKLSTSVAQKNNNNAVNFTKKILHVGTAVGNAAKKGLDEVNFLKRNEKEKYQIATLIRLKEMESAEILSMSDMDQVTAALRPFSSEDFDSYEYIDQVFDKKKVAARSIKRDKIMKNRFEKMGNKMKDNLNIAKRLYGGASKPSNTSAESDSDADEESDAENSNANSGTDKKMNYNSNRNSSSSSNSNNNNNNNNSNNNNNNNSNSNKSAPSPIQIKKGNKSIKKMLSPFKRGKKSDALQEAAAHKVSVSDGFVETVNKGTHDLGKNVFNMMVGGTIVKTSENNNLSRGVEKGAVDREFQIKISSIRKENRKIIEKMKNVSQEQLNVLKLFREAIAKELQREVYGHYALFINTSKTVSQMEQDWNLLSLHFNDITESCRMAGTWDEQETNKRMKKLKSKMDHFNLLSNANNNNNNNNNSSSSRSGGGNHAGRGTNNNKNTGSDPLAGLAEVNAELVSAIYAHQLEYAMKLFVKGAEYVNILTDFNANIQMQRQMEEKQQMLPIAPARRNSGSTSVNIRQSIRMEGDFLRQQAIIIQKQKEELNDVNIEELTRDKWEVQYKQLILVMQQFDKNCSQLQELMLNEIRMKMNWSSIEYYRFLIHNLTLMDARNEAIYTYLESQADLVRESLAKITGMTGDPVTYASILSRRFFRLISDAAKRYKSIFIEQNDLSSQKDNDNNNNNNNNNNNKIKTEHKYSSGLVQWLVRELQEQYCVTFREQVFSACNKDLKLVTECCAIAFEQADVLKKDGILLNYLVRDNFREDISLAIESFVWKYEDEISLKLKAERWDGATYLFKENGSLLPIAQQYEQQQTGVINDQKPTSLFVTETGKVLFKFCNEFAELLEKIVSIQLYQTSITYITRLLEQYLVEVFKIAAHSELSDNQYFALISNVNALLNTLVPHITKAMERLFEQKIPELTLLRNKTKDLDSRLIKQYCQSRTLTIFKALGFDNKMYPKQNRPNSSGSYVQSVNNIQVSSSFRNMILFISKLNKGIMNFPMMRKSEIILPSLLDKLAEEICNKDNGSLFWERLGTDNNTNAVSLKEDGSDNDEKEEDHSEKSVSKTKSDDHYSDKDEDEEENDERTETASNESGDESESTGTNSSDSEKKARKIIPLHKKPALKSKASTKSEDKVEKKEKNGTNSPQTPTDIPLFTEIDIHTIVLDLRFLIESTKRVMYSKSKLRINKLIKHIVDIYSKVHNIDMNKDSDFYYSKIDDLLEKDRDLVDAIKSLSEVQKSKNQMEQQVASRINEDNDNSDSVTENNDIETNDDSDGSNN
jgi:hypothetical protein